MVRYHQILRVSREIPTPLQVSQGLTSFHAFHMLLQIKDPTILICVGAIMSVGKSRFFQAFFPKGSP